MFKFSRLPHPHRCTRHPRTTPPTKSFQVLDCSLIFLSQISTKKLGKPSSRQALEGVGNSKLYQIVHIQMGVLEKNHGEKLTAKSKTIQVDPAVVSSLKASFRE